MADVAIRRTGSKNLYSGRIVKLTLDTYQTADGRRFRRETIRHPASVVILPIIGTSNVVLIRQFRNALERYIYEIPAGTSEPGESLLRCAKRELAEEAGYRASRWCQLHEFYPAPGVSTERMVLYRAQGLTPLSRAPAKDKDEYITTVVVPAHQALKMVEKNVIVDAKSIIGILFGLNKIRWSSNGKHLR
ncbi:MAG: NUDIX hydrolase [Candidatus Omnitrophica bacterium]|nr:NUDIX hydrolase [Candidatus Omnitrophota bacterium]